MTSTPQPLLPPMLGILVGGKNQRMGGQPKGLLKAPGESCSIVEALSQRFHATAPAGETVLLGTAPVYQHLKLRQLPDDPPGVGPIGGLNALLKLAKAEGRNCLLLGCDMPSVSHGLMAKLVHAESVAPAVSVQHNGYWEPLFSRFDCVRTLPVISKQLAARRYGLFSLLDELGCMSLPLSATEREQLRDWDTPEDLRRDWR